jgi:hypothetical protein
MGKTLVMDEEVLNLLAQGGVTPDPDGNLRLYHATTQSAAKAIVEQLELRPRFDDDPAIRALQRRDGGEVYLASLPSIQADLGAEALVAVRLPTTVSAELLRASIGDPARVELVVQLSPGAALPLVTAEVVMRDARRDNLPESVQEAISMFETAPVGRQLRDLDEQSGRCRRASMRFIAALRQAGTDGRLLEWASGFVPDKVGWWHHAVLLEGSEVMVDWTAAQFEQDEVAAPAVPFPRIEPRATAEARWGPGRERSPDDRGGFMQDLPPMLPWSAARECIPERDSPQQRLHRF